MATSKWILLLLACVLLSTLTTGIVHASGCTPDPDIGICVTTDKTTYNPGEAVTVTVDVAVPPNIPSVTASIAIFPLPPSPCGLSCATAWGNVTLVGSGTEVWSGTVAIRLPDHVTAGNYEVQVFGPQWAPYASTEIAVTGQTPVPETQSVLGLLLPALLVGIYILGRKKNSENLDR